jgi:hypothetical protein
VLAAAALGAVTAERARGFWTPPQLLIVMFLGVETLHVCFVNIEWFYRYEAYAVAVGSMAVLAALADLHATGRLSTWVAHANPVRRAAAIVAVVVLALPLFLRGFFAVTSTSIACGEIYRQQVQMGNFFREHFAGETIAVNDIGAVSWMAPVHIVDLIGLASNDVARARRTSRVDAAFIRQLAAAQNVQVAAIYEPHFRTMRELPSEWIKVGEWSMPRVLAVGGPSVAFFAPTASQVDRLRAALDDFSRGLPEGVTYVRAARQTAN